ncbi:MAG: hypothetical protein JNL01_08215 [Bdellovibrionales bacterium]|nr:hypothetical protein [Bdellovibrionales bacterium]
MKVQSALKSENIPSFVQILKTWSGRGLSLLAGAFVGILLSALFQNGQGSQPNRTHTDEKVLKTPHGMMNRSR